MGNWFSTEKNKDNFKLIVINSDDLLHVDEMSKIKEYASTLDNVDFIYYNINNIHKKIGDRPPLPDLLHNFISYFPFIAIVSDKAWNKNECHTNDICVYKNGSIHPNTIKFWILGVIDKMV